MFDVGCWMFYGTMCCACQRREVPENGAGPTALPPGLIPILCGISNWATGACPFQARGHRRPTVSSENNAGCGGGCRRSRESQSYPWQGSGESPMSLPRLFPVSMLCFGHATAVPSVFLKIGRLSAILDPMTLKNALPNTGPAAQILLCV
jgi:hypothetical protein